MNVFRTAAMLAAAAAAGPAAAASGDGAAGGSALLTPQIGTIFWTVVTFLLLVLLLRRFAWGPLLGAIDAREKSIHDSIEQARRDRERAEALVQEQKAMLTEARRERAEAVEQGKRDAEKVKAEILDAARKERERVLEDTQAQVGASLRKARAELRAEAVDLALGAARKLLAANLDDATQRRLVEDHLADLERSGDATSPN
jgi:F-type H+-transporting ATPase subunit b